MQESRQGSGSVEKCYFAFYFSGDFSIDDRRIFPTEYRRNLKRAESIESNAIESKSSSTKSCMVWNCCRDPDSRKFRSPCFRCFLSVCFQHLGISYILEGLLHNARYCAVLHSLQLRLVLLFSFRFVSIRLIRLSRENTFTISQQPRYRHYPPLRMLPAAGVRILRLFGDRKHPMDRYLRRKRTWNQRGN